MMFSGVGFRKFQFEFIMRPKSTTEVETVPVVQIEKAESPGVCDIPYFGKYYLFHRWFMTIEFSGMFGIG